MIYRYCCFIPCNNPAEYEVWPRGKPNGLEMYQIVGPGDYEGYAWYEACTDACLDHLEDAKGVDPNAVAIHLSRVYDDKWTVSLK